MGFYVMSVKNFYFRDEIFQKYFWFLKTCWSRDDRGGGEPRAANSPVNVVLRKKVLDIEEGQHHWGFQAFVVPW